MLIKYTVKYVKIYFIIKITYSICSDRILTFGIRSIRSPAKVGIGYYKAVTTRPVVSWRGWEDPPPSITAQLSFFAQPPLS